MKLKSSRLATILILVDRIKGNLHPHHGWIDGGIELEGISRGGVVVREGLSNGTGRIKIRPGKTIDVNGLVSFEKGNRQGR